MARRVSRDKLSYPIENFNAFELGAEYIHSNWLFFENTVNKSFNGEDLLMRIAKKLHSGLIKIVKQEIAYYQGLETEYLKNVRSNSELEGLSRTQIKDRFYSKYKKQLKNKQTSIGKLETYKVKSVATTRWPKSPDVNFDMKTELEMQAEGKKGRSLEELKRDLKSGIDVLFSIVNGRRLDARLGNFLVKHPERYIKGATKLKISDPKFQEAVKLQIAKVQNKLPNIDEGERVGPSDARLISQILEDIGIHSFIGRRAEELTPRFINNYLSALSAKGAKLMSEKFKQDNIIDIHLLTFNYKKSDVAVGLSQKYLKHPYFQKSYSVKNDIYSAVNNFSDLKLKGTAELRRNAQYMMYIRKNLAALNSWALDSPKGIIDYDSFVSKEAAILFLLNFLRFFNGTSFLIENGTYELIQGSDNLETRFGKIFNVFLLTRFGVYYTVDFLTYILEAIENFESIIFSKNTKNIKFKIDGFSASVEPKSQPRINSSKLWNKKRKALKKLKKGRISDREKEKGIRELTYKNLQEEILDALKEVGDEAGALLFDRFSYYLNPGVIQKKYNK